MMTDIVITANTANTANTVITAFTNLFLITQITIQLIFGLWLPIESCLEWLERNSDYLNVSSLTNDNWMQSWQKEKKKKQI